MYQHQTDRILEKVKQLGLKLDPVISAERLIEIEKELNVRFPESYRIFLTQIQNGGASDNLDKKGPYYGIYPIEKSIEEIQEWEIDLSQPFPLTEDLEYAEQNQTDIQQVLDQYQNTSTIEGSFPICEYGCGDFFRLVITGEKSGEVWVDSGLINDTGFYSLKVDILTFFENWLNRQIEILSDPTKKLVNAYYSFLEFGNNERYKITE